jgi:hypothetical protein
MCTRVSLFKSCNVWDFGLSWLSILILSFKLPWLVLTKWHETSWLASYLPHSPSLALISLTSFKLSFIKWLWLLSCCMELCTLCFHHIFILLNYMCCAFFICILRGFFIFVFHNAISCCNHTGVLHFDWIPLLMILMFAMVLSLAVSHKHQDAL